MLSYIDPDIFFITQMRVFFVACLLVCLFVFVLFVCFLPKIYHNNVVLCGCVICIKLCLNFIFI